MSHGGGRHTPGDDLSGGLANAVEGYLLARTHQDRARREAESLCARMPWLTTAQAEDVTRHYVHQRLELTRQMLLETVERAAQLRQEYEDRYAALRHDLLRRHVTCAAAVVACASGATTLAWLLAR
ncbi:hypothetical protein ACIBBD_03475 [Streptomyces sp. NPDC051315]|uniref:hypothetical protein n=1 Tax=Streptomyces sp. NPDC051315 TaxID=3365650 RepID=UPI0037B74A3D